MKNLEDIINSIKNKDFDKYENEKNKKLKKDKLENSIQILKSKINKHENEKKYIMHENEKKYIIKDNSREKLKIKI
jgi:hypothetical protein